MRKKIITLFGIKFIDANKTLISNVSAVDSNIFYLNNFWWLLTNIDSSNSGDHCSELHAFYSEDLFTNEWKPHLKNPLVFHLNF